MSQQIEILTGNSLSLLPTFEANSFDSCVTDPPYELGFMGKAWDSTGIAYNVDLWREVYRVLKPGAYLLAFGGSRTYHRMACAIEDAGFEIRDQIQWIYGCLSDDTEILTSDGWKRNHTDIVNSSVLCYNVENEGFEFHKPTKHFSYANQHTAYRIKSDFTDQIVSRNHRVLIERSGRKEFICAEALEREANIPFLESLSDLPNSIYDFHKGTSVEKSDLLKRVSNQDAGVSEKAGNQTSQNFHLPSLRQRLSKAIRQKIKNLWLQMQWRFAWRGMETTRSQRAQSVESGIGTSVHRANDRRDKSCVERWRHLYAEKGLLLQRCFDQVRSLSAGIYLNGPQRRLCYGTPAFSGSSDWAASDADRNGASLRPQSNEQPSQQSRPLCDEPRSQAIRGSRLPASTLARVTPVEYNGNVWCVEVPTGAFVARRNGKIFITGNSGFPKSLDVSKAIDKMKGAEREVLGTRSNGAGNKPNGNSFDDDNYEWSKTVAITAPATDEAKQWDGWGTSLKPANEPICLARKPLEKGLTVAQNVLKWGTGALNIDKCRVTPSGPPPASHAYRTDSEYADASPQGRFPANVIHDGSDEVLAAFPDAQGQQGDLVGHSKDRKSKGIYGDMAAALNAIARNDTGSAARFFYCAKASGADRNHGLEGFESKYVERDNGFSAKLSDTKNPRQNHHPTVKPVELMQYLCRLVTPPNGLILDPFLGSGSTAKAALIERFRAVGIELNPEYAEIADARCRQLQVNLF